MFSEFFYLVSIFFINYRQIGLGTKNIQYQNDQPDINNPILLEHVFPSSNLSEIVHLFSTFYLYLILLILCITYTEISRFRMGEIPTTNGCRWKHGPVFGQGYACIFFHIK